MITVSDLIIAALRTSKTPLTNESIRKIVQRKRATVSRATIDTSLSTASKKGLINKTPATGLARSKFVYSAVRLPSTRKVVLASLTGAKMDSLQVHSVVTSVLPTVQKDRVDNVLYKLAKDGVINKSKNPMTDSNTISSQSKFLYSL